jgi:oligopeptide/dipeptide ABC transporter ATP-binding protein
VTATLLELKGLGMEYRAPRGSGGKRIQAVRGIDLSVAEGQIVGLVGETGSGKTTVGKCVARLVEPTSGSVHFDGLDITHLSRRALRPMRQQVQMVFQDPYSSLDPRMTVAQIVAEPLRAHGRPSRFERGTIVETMIERVGLSGQVLDRYPSELSGGQRQRVGLARALVLAPKLLVADEPVSALDVSVRAGILNLMVDLQRSMGFSCLFITHDLSVAEFLCDRVSVMYLGEIVEAGSREELFYDARHPYTRSLLAAAPVPDPVVQRSKDRSTLPGDPPSALNPPAGCSLHPRCPLANARCSAEIPAVTTVSETGHFARCHRVEEQLSLEVPA